MASLPRILCLLDKNPLSPTYGSFDRKYWQYKIIDFPCGMQQELILPLAYLWKTAFPENRYYNSERIRTYIEGALLFHRKCCHSDGSMDDYFPHERAFGATAYALAASTEAALLAGICPDGVLPAFEKSGDFLARYREAGLLSNHLAIAALALLNLSLLTGNQRWSTDSRQLVEELKAKQDGEGWFPEYDGCDAGYQTVTIEFLSRCYRKSPSEATFAILQKACRFLWFFVHPDGSLGGEYGSRNTYNFYPGGFALLSRDIPEAAQILLHFYKGFASGARNYLADDGTFGHLLSSYVTVLSSGDTVTKALGESKAGETPHITYFPKAGLFSGQAGRYAIFGTTTKGGVYKVFKNGALLYSDTGFAGRLTDGTCFCQNNANSSVGDVRGNSIEIEGEFREYDSSRLTRLHTAGLRMLSMVFGRHPKYSNIIRQIMQAKLIYKRKGVGHRFRRLINLAAHGVIVSDTIDMKGRKKIAEIYRSTDCVNAHVITSDSFQSANLLCWEKAAFGASQSRIEIVKEY